jgi:hypothetical protein
VDWGTSAFNGVMVNGRMNQVLDVRLVDEHAAVIPC